MRIIAQEKRHERRYVINPSIPVPKTLAQAPLMSVGKSPAVSGRSYSCWMEPRAGSPATGSQSFAKSSLSYFQPFTIFLYAHQVLFAEGPAG
jgi:hypothetical protein